MAKLNQILAVEKGAKSSSENAITAAYHTIQKPELFSGLSRTYEPKDDEGEKLPPEHQKVIATVPDVITAFTDALTNLFDVTATKDWANTTAKANIVVDGATLVADVPVTYLLFVEKRLIDVMTFLNRLPTLDPAQDWHFDDAAGCYVTEPVTTHRAKKVLRNHVKAEATDKHQAQVDVFTEDETIGYWSKVLLSGAVPITQITAWKARVLSLQAAVKFAREEANSAEIEQKKVGKVLFDHLFA